MNCSYKKEKKKLKATGAQHSLGKSQVSNTSLLGYPVTQIHSSMAQVSKTVTEIQQQFLGYFTEQPSISSAAAGLQ